MKKTIAINFFGGPGCGKSTQAAMLFAQLKIRGFNVELVTEYPKDKVWEESFHVLKNQIYLFAKQHHRMWRLVDKVDLIITDSPLCQYLAYSEHMSPSFKTLVTEEFLSFHNVNIFLERGQNKYHQEGREQTIEGAKLLDASIMRLLPEGQVFHKIEVNDRAYENIIVIIDKTIKEEALGEVPIV